MLAWESHGGVAGGQQRRRRGRGQELRSNQQALEVGCGGGGVPSIALRPPGGNGR